MVDGEPTEKVPVTVIGLGIMGHSFARHLAKGRWQVFGHDISEHALQRASGLGVEVCSSLEEALEAAQIILLSLPNASAANDVVGQLNALDLSPRIIVELSTFTPEEKSQLSEIAARKDHQVLDCPVSGTGAQAAEQDIVVYASGEQEAIDRALPILQAFSREVIVLGEFGQGTKMKLVANLLVAIHNVASAEALALGMASGLEPEDIIRSVKSGAGNSRIFELRAPMMARRDFADATMKLGVWEKDLAAIGSLASQLGARTPLLLASAPIYSSITREHPDWDTAAVFEVICPQFDDQGKR